MEQEALYSIIREFREKKNKSSFEKIYRHFSPKFYYICLRYLKNEQDAQDALQEVFITVFKKIEALSDEKSFEGWMRRIAVNSCLDRLRKTKEFSLVKTLSDNDEESLPGEDNQESWPEELLFQALKELPAGYSTIINLYILEDYSHREIAETLGISEATSRSQLTRAKAVLKSKLLAYAKAGI